MFIVYDIIFLIIAIFFLPVYLFRGKFHGGFWARLGFFSKDLKLDKPIWVHAVSVGEAMAAKELIAGLRKAYPAKRLVISTVTPTGNKIARGLATETDLVTYLPLDFSFSVRTAIKRIDPSLFIIVETELWPNLISYLHKKKIPVVIVNGRLSDDSFRGYSAIKFLLKSVLKKVSLFCVQSENDKRKLISLGVSQEDIQVTGNMKFDATGLKIEANTLIQCRRNLALEETDKLWVCGSTHPGEEKMLLEAYKNLLKSYPALKLLIAPRHPERAQEVADLIKRFNFEPVRLSLLNLRTEELKNLRAVFILDTVGQMMDYYALADIVFVGGTLVKKGGHNILEPASLGKAILFGPYMFNFRDIAELFLARQAAILVYNTTELEKKISQLLDAPSGALVLAQRARDTITLGSGATTRNLELIKRYAR
ncbi:MAG: 3-deoxy-D-manno-octulosonic acid transferase [Candidatus Omnitrophica bacterium]|nr:3-deoxy-D-manno-octulosonic acid transferase [Candidatus Omnitrophota bacterium]